VVCILIWFRAYERSKSFDRFAFANGNHYCLYFYLFLVLWTLKNTWEVCLDRWESLHHKLTKLHRFMQNSVFIGLYKNYMNSMLWLIWMIFVHIQYLKCSNRGNIVFEWHTWMFMFNTQKSHNFIQNYITIIAQF
jgi:hypothetical protein